MSDKPDPLAELVEMLVFAPLGLVFEAKRVLPELAKRGKQEAANAKSIGKFVVPIARRQIQSKLHTLRAEVPRPAPPRSSATTASTVVPPPSSAVRNAERAAGTSDNLSSRSPQTASPRKPANPRKSATQRKPANPKSANLGTSVSSNRAVAGPELSTLPIENYDSLPSAAVVELLDRLDPAALKAVLAYEQANRKRRTIISRASQRLA